MFLGHSLLAKQKHGCCSPPLQLHKEAGEHAEEWDSETKGRVFSGSGDAVLLRGQQGR